MCDLCAKCHGFGRYLSNVAGRVTATYCTCSIGQAWVKKLRENTCIEDKPTTKELRFYNKTKEKY